jgi:HlyD family secretion protein
MRLQTSVWRSKPAIVVAVVLGATLTVGLAYETAGHHAALPLAQKYDLADVCRTDLYPALTAAGRVESSARTVIECELENITIGVLGRRLWAGGSSVLLSIVPEGSMVHRGDVLAVLDSSEYEELFRQQKITVERARADHRRSELEYEIARLAVCEFRDGSMAESIKDFERGVALAESDLMRCTDRLDWAQRMKSKGYVPASLLTNEKFNHARALFTLGEERNAYSLFTKWTAPRTLKILENDVLAAEATLKYQTSRLNRNLDRLAKLEKQIELCTIRAPHDGFVIYANDERREIRIEEGMYVRQRQGLMYLPDLQQMEVVADLHESIMPEVAKGMRAKVVVEGLPGRKLEGHVTDIAVLPSFNWRSDVRYFDGKVKLDNPPQGILPGMTAHVEIALNRRDNVLAVPVEAVTQEDGREICYVAHEDGLERREVKLGEGTQDFLEISNGLHEGEQVVLKPVLSEVEQDTNDETRLVSEATFSEEIADANLSAPFPVTTNPVSELH